MASNSNSEVTIYHNPKCSQSRNTLGLIRNAGIEPKIVLYLETPPTKEELKKIIKDLGIPVLDLVRIKEDATGELKLADPSWTDDKLIDLMISKPIFMNRPIVVTKMGTKLCRPSEEVLHILDSPQKGFFAKEDGEVVVDKDGKRVK